jgi:hypothetical protein
MRELLVAVEIHAISLSRRHLIRGGYHRAVLGLIVMDSSLKLLSFFQDKVLKFRSMAMVPNLRLYFPVDLGFNLHHEVFVAKPGPDVRSPIVLDHMNLIRWDILSHLLRSSKVLISVPLERCVMVAHSP